MNSLQTAPTRFYKAIIFRIKLFRRAAAVIPHFNAKRHYKRLQLLSIRLPVEYRSDLGNKENIICFYFDTVCTHKSLYNKRNRLRSAICGIQAVFFHGRLQ